MAPKTTRAPPLPKQTHHASPKQALAAPAPLLSRCLQRVAPAWRQQLLLASASQGPWCHALAWRPAVPAPLRGGATHCACLARGSGPPTPAARQPAGRSPRGSSSQSQPLGAHSRGCCCSRLGGCAEHRSGQGNGGGGSGQRGGSDTAGGWGRAPGWEQATRGSCARGSCSSSQQRRHPCRAPRWGQHSTGGSSPTGQGPSGCGCRWCGCARCWICC